MAVFQYDIEMKVRNKKTGVERLITRTEYCYSIQEVIYQSAVNSAGDIGKDEEFVRCTHIGPAAAEIQLSTSELLRSIEKAMLAVTKKSEK